MESFMGIFIFLALHLEYCPKAKVYYVALDQGEPCDAKCVPDYYEKYCVDKVGTPPNPPTGVKAVKQ